MLPIYVPISLRRTERGVRQGNLIAQMAVPLPLDARDAASRLRQIAAETAKRKAKSRVSIGTMFRSWWSCRTVSNQGSGFQIPGVPESCHFALQTIPPSWQSGCTPEKR